jgi:hypothetical protein
MAFQAKFWAFSEQENSVQVAKTAWKTAISGGLFFICGGLL